MKALDLFAALYGVEIQIGLKPGQRSTRSFSMICRLLQAMVVFVWENCSLSFYHFYTEWTLATELHQPYPRNKQWVLGAATSPEATDLGFCSSPVVVWVEMVLVIFIKPVEGTNICQ